MRALLITVALAAATATAHADGGMFQVSPTQVDLSASAQTAAVTVSNHGAARLRLQLAAYAWTDDRAGQMQLVPTKDVMVRPALIVIEPGTTRTVRVATLVKAGAAEASYRVFFEELPERTGTTVSGIHMLTRIGVPVFVAPTTATQDATVAATLAGGDAKVTVTNTGSLHAKVMNVSVTAKHGDRVAWSHAIAGWYVLPAATRDFAVPLDGSKCTAGDSLVTSVVDGSGATWSTTVPCH